MNQEVATEDGAVVEISSPRSVKIICGFMGLLFCGMGVMLSLCAVLPQMLEHRPDKLPTTVERLLYFFIGGPVGFGMGLFMLQPWFYRLRADAYALTESFGWKEKRVFWSDVDSFTVEYKGSRQDDAQRFEKPVLRDVRGAVLLDFATFSSDPIGRERLILCVQSHLSGKQKPFAPIPSPYEGKSTAWKIKRATAIGLGILAFMGLWSVAMMWASAHPELPNWVLPAINLSALLLPLGAAHVALFLGRRRQKKLLAESEPAST